MNGFLLLRIFNNGLNGLNGFFRGCTCLKCTNQARIGLNRFLQLGIFNNGLNGFLLLEIFNSGLIGLNGFLLLEIFNNGLIGLNGFRLRC